MAPAPLLFKPVWLQLSGSPRQPDRASGSRPPRPVDRWRPLAGARPLATRRWASLSRAGPTPRGASSRQALAALRASSPSAAASSCSAFPRRSRRAPRRPPARWSAWVAAAPAAAQESGGGFSISLPSFSIPNNFEAAPKAVKPADSEAAPVKPFKVRGDKVYINPSDEFDLDEVPLGAPNPPLLAAFLFGPSFIYLAFWVLGSLEII
ncbi:unnamed protein product [Prorocentrum cordatum]|uniref:Uncharacterized protein n=1 Tax=Prorocentrum cordatum TaxID=2364126 RepID=A0ABN9RSP7_9DINO|nr:unnamed protein product [Polarella glacialis]